MNNLAKKLIMHAVLSLLHSSLSIPHTSYISSYHVSILYGAGGKRRERVVVEIDEMPFSLSSPVLRQPSPVISAPRHTIRIHTPITPLPASSTSPPASSSPQTVLPRPHHLPRPSHRDGRHHRSQHPDSPARRRLRAALHGLHAHPLPPHLHPRALSHSHHQLLPPHTAQLLRVPRTSYHLDYLISRMMRWLNWSICRQSKWLSTWAERTVWNLLSVHLPLAPVLVTRTAICQ